MIRYDLRGEIGVPPLCSTANFVAGRRKSDEKSSVLISGFRKKLLLATLTILPILFTPRLHPYNAKASYLKLVNEKFDRRNHPRFETLEIQTSALHIVKAIRNRPF